MTRDHTHIYAIDTQPHYMNNQKFCKCLICKNWIPQEEER